MSYPVRVGAMYQHYKGLRYKVLAIAHNESDLDRGAFNNFQVIYKAVDPCSYCKDKLGSANPVFIRPLTNFIENVTIGNATQPRFIKIAPNSTFHKNIPKPANPTCVFAPSTTTGSLMELGAGIASIRISQDKK